MNNIATNSLAHAIQNYFRNVADKRDPIKTDMVDQKTVGAVTNRSVTMPSEVSLKLKANKGQKHILHVIHKSANGVLTLNTVFPFQQVTMATQGSGLNTVNVGVITPASSAKHERAIGTNVDNKALAFGNSNFAAFSRLFSSNTLNGATIVGNLTETYIPKLTKTWTEPYHKEVKDLSPDLSNGKVSVGTAINHITLRLWEALKVLETAKNLTDAQRSERIQKFWNDYQTVFNDWVNKYNYLDKSLAVYAEPNGVDPDVSAYLGIHAVADELNPAKIYSAEGETSFVPEVNRGYISAIVLGDETDEEEKFKFGIYKASASNREELETLTDEEEISKTVEVCTRRVLITDGAGNTTKVQVRVRDESYGPKNIIKHSRSFFNIPVGSTVEIRGKLNFRMVKAGSLAITAEIVTNKFKVYGAQNAIVGDIVTNDIVELNEASLTDSFLDIIGEADVLEATDNTQLHNSDDLQQPDTGVVPSETQSDDNM